MQLRCMVVQIVVLFEDYERTMLVPSKWYFSKQSLANNTPSSKFGYDAAKEFSYRQQAAEFILDLGQHLALSQLCINTAVVYMHRFYVIHSFAHFQRYAIATAALFVAAKVENESRSSQSIILVKQSLLYRDQPSVNVESEQYLEEESDLFLNESFLLQTLGFDVGIEHPHFHIVKCCHYVCAGDDLEEASLIIASSSLHLTKMCLQYRPTVVACFCIYLACLWCKLQIPLSSQGKHWFNYLDKEVTQDFLNQLIAEFRGAIESCPPRLRRKIQILHDSHLHPGTNHQWSQEDASQHHAVHRDSFALHAFNIDPSFCQSKSSVKTTTNGLRLLSVPTSLRDSSFCNTVMIG